MAQNKAIQAAAAKSKPLTEEYVEKRGRKHHRSRRVLSVTSINKTITRLGQILEVAVEYGLIGANPAKGRRRRLKARKTSPVWLDRAEHIEALLNAAGELDRQAEIKGGQDQRGRLIYRRALLATLVFAGLRIGELTALRWRDVDLADYRITVRQSKTDAGIRQIDILPALHDELSAHKAHAPSTAPDAFVFAAATGTELAQGNVRRRVLDKATEKLSKEGRMSNTPPMRILGDAMSALDEIAFLTRENDSLTQPHSTSAKQEQT